MESADTAWEDDSAILASGSGAIVEPAAVTANLPESGPSLKIQTCKALMTDEMTRRAGDPLKPCMSPQSRAYCVLRQSLDGIWRFDSCYYL